MVRAAAAGRRAARWKHERRRVRLHRLAPRYDELWTDTAIGRAQRDAVWRHVDPLFRRAIAFSISAAAPAKTPRIWRRAGSRCTPSMRRRRWWRDGAATAADRAVEWGAAEVPRQRIAAGASRWRHLQFRRAELRGRSRSGRARVWATLVRPGGTSPSASSAASARGRRSTTAPASISAKRSAGCAAVARRSDHVHYPTVRQIRAAFRARISNCVMDAESALLVPPSYVSFPPRWSAGRRLDRSLAASAAPARAGRPSPADLRRK